MAVSPGTEPLRRGPGGVSKAGSNVRRIVALDLSLRATGYATFDSRESPWTLRTGEIAAPGLRKNSPPEVYAERLDGIGSRVMAAARDAHLAVIEGYSFGSRHLAHAMGELGGHVRWLLWRAAIPVAVLPPACVKKLATGRGNAPKTDVLLASVRRLGYTGTSHNVADALWLLQAALHRYRLPGATKLPKQHTAALAKTNWPF